MMSWIRVGLPLALLSLCSQSACGQHPDQLCMRRSFWKVLLWKLNNINPTFTPACRSEYNASLQLPTILRPRIHDTAVAAEALLNAFHNLFSQPNIPLPSRPHIIFLNSLSEILSQLRSCVNSQDSDYVSRSNIRERFQKVEDFVNQKGNSDCAWEVVHVIDRDIIQEAAMHHPSK